MHRPFAAVLSVVVLAGCGGTPPPAAKPTWHKDVAPLVERSCGSCHQAGGIAPFPLSTLEQVKKMGAAVRSAVEAKRMPPFLAIY